MMVIVMLQSNLQLIFVQTSQGIPRSPSHEMLLGEVYLTMSRPVKCGEFVHTVND